MSPKNGKATITDVAKLADVSTATAGRVLGGYGYTSEKMKEKVLSAAKELGYIPNLLARSLMTGRTKTIGVVAGDIESPFYASIIRGIADVAERRGIGLIITNSDEDLNREISSVRLLLEKQVDGLILSPCEPRRSEHLAAAMAAGIPLVQVDRMVHGLDVDFVGVDNRTSSAQAVGYLLRLGHRRIGMIGELVHDEIDLVTFVDKSRGDDRISDSLYPSWQRLHGYLDAHRAAGVDIDERLIRQAGAYTAEAAERQAQLLLADRNMATAIFTADGLMTAGTMSAISASRLTVPDDLSLICFDDLDWMSFLSPGIDAIAQPRGAMGAAAAEILLDRIDKLGGKIRTIKMNPRIINRGSVAPPRLGGAA